MIGSDKDKKVSNEEWTSPSDPDSRIAKMKDGTTHLAYKAEHVVDLKTELILAAAVYPADQPDSATLLESVVTAQVNLEEAESGLSLEELVDQREAAVAELTVIDEAVADKGYHKAETLADCAAVGVRTYIPEKRRKQKRVWTDKPPEWERAYRNNRRRVGGAGASGCRSSAARRWNGRSRMCVRRGAVVGAGCVACSRSARVT